MRLEHLIAAVLSIGLGASGQLLLKIGAGQISQVGRDGGIVSFLISIAMTWQLVLGLVFYAVSALVWIHVLSNVNLSLAYPLIGISFIFVVALGVFVLGESLSMMQIIGCGVILVGITLVLRGQA
ncbi:EamA family transporter [Primorskyibacter sp. S187A]|uniref:EamA family transporter n=1 Tax=Primorskyibacter sp. S187A TaxID=3415130 RepID=UPI003C7C5695